MEILLNVAHTPITFTLHGVYVGLLGVCGVIAAVWGVVKIIAEIKQLLNKKDEKQDAQIKALKEESERMKAEILRLSSALNEKQESIIDNSKELALTQRGLFVLLKSQQASLNHMIYGNHIDHLQKSVKDIDNFIDEFSLWSISNEEQEKEV